MNKKAWIWGLVATVVLGGAWVIASRNGGSHDTGPIKIGFIGPLTGDAASFGETEKNATQMAVNAVNAGGGINGKEVDVIYEDGRCTGEGATSAINKLISVDHVQVILGGACSAETLAAAPIAEQNKVILFSAFSSNPAITNAGDYIFRDSPSDADVARLDANTIINGGYKKVALISENSDYAQGVRQIMIDAFKSADVAAVLDQNFISGTTDFRDVVLKIKQSGADVIYVNPASSGKTGALLVKQLRQADVTTPVHGNFSLATPDSYTTGGSYLDGVVVSDTAKVSQALTDLAARYEKEFNGKPANMFEFGAAYDRANLILDSIKSVGYDADAIKRYLYGVKDYSGVIGTFGFDQNGDVTGGPFFSEYTIKNRAETPLQ